MLFPLVTANLQRLFHRKMILDVADQSEHSEKRALSYLQNFEQPPCHVASYSVHKLIKVSTLISAL